MRITESVGNVELVSCIEVTEGQLASRLSIYWLCTEKTVVKDRWLSVDTANVGLTPYSSKAVEDRTRIK